MSLPADNRFLAKPISEAQEKERKLTTEELFQGQKIVIIHHAGEDYRLTVTRNNRLILQK